MAETRSFPVPEGLDGQRLDAAIARLFGLSRTSAADVVETGGATVDGKTADKSDRVRAGQWLEVELPAPPAAVTTVPTPVDALTVVHEDDDIIVVDKPVGVAAHPSPGWTGPTVVGALMAQGSWVAQTGGAEREGIVHRLDVGTSGLMVVARSERAYRLLKAAFRDREVDKTYHALVQGHPDPLRGTIDAPIDRHPTAPFKFAVVADGKPSITHYETLEAFRAATLLEVHLETGRTHQIRVHMAAIKHPCVGDLQYGADPTLAERLGLRRQWLQAVRLGFVHPGSGEPIVFTSPYPHDLATALEVLTADSA
jgi:23S rRNA pseudouridine1911/1915/1917 synthase